MPAKASDGRVRRLVPRYRFTAAQDALKRARVAWTADALERLERACEHLGITGHQLAHLADIATARLADTAARRPTGRTEGTTA